LDKIWTRKGDCRNLPNIKSLAKIMRIRRVGNVALITMKESKIHSETQTSYVKPVTMDDKQIW
jgi:hypothetical protein